MFRYPHKGLDILVNVTNICDARCIMCNIWKNHRAADSFITPELLQSVHPVSSISFAGGEPFMHRNVVEAVQFVHDNNAEAKVIFSTNGLRTDDIADKVAQILAFHKHTQVTISLDGTRTMHNRVRGRHDAWERANRTYERLGEIGLSRRNFAFTITSENYACLPEVYAHVRNLKAGLSIGVAQSSKYLNVQVPRLDLHMIAAALNPVIDDLLRGWHPLGWARAFFLHGLLRYVETGQRPIPCDALTHQIMIDQSGSVFSCHPAMWKAGELREGTLASILNAPATEELRATVRQCQDCWQVCSARSGIRSQVTTVGLWAARNKLLAHLGQRGGSQTNPLLPRTTPPNRPRMEP
jgi:Fe-coproporphyrin III synthase